MLELVKNGAQHQVVLEVLKGLYAQNGGQASSQNDTINTQGSSAFGLNAEGGTLASTNDEVTTTGDSAVGLADDWRPWKLRSFNDPFSLPVCREAVPFFCTSY